MLELPLLVLDVGDHLAHEVRLIHLRETLADTVGALIEPKRHRHCHGADHAAVAAGLAQVFEQNVAAEGITDRVQRRERSFGPQVSDGFGEVFTGTGMVAAWQQIRFPRAAAPVQRDAGPALGAQCFLHAGHVR